MKEKLTVGNHINCLIEKVELNYVLASFTSDGVTYRGILINEGCSTVRRFIPESNLNDEIITVEPEREDARDRLLRNKKTYGPDYNFTKVVRSKTSELRDVNLTASRNLKTRKSHVQHGNLATSQTLLNKKSPAQDSSLKTPRTSSGKKSCAQDGNLKKSPTLRDEKARIQDDKCKISSNVVGKKSQIDNDNLAISRTSRVEKSQVQDHNCAKSRSVGSKKSQVEDDNITISKTLRSEKSQVHDDNIATFRFLRSKKSHNQDNNLITSRTLRSKKSQVQEKNLTTSRTLDGKKSHAQDDNVTKPQFLKSKNSHVKDDNHAKLKNVGIKKSQVKDTSLATSRASRTEKSKPQVDDSVKRRSVVGSKKSQVDDKLATSQTLRIEKSQVQDHPAKSRTVEGKKSHGKDDNLAKSRNLRTEKAQVHDNKLVKPRSVGNKQSHVDNDNLATSNNLKVEKSQVRGNNLATSRILRSKRTQVQDDNLATSRILSSKSTHGQNNNIATSRGKKSQVQDHSFTTSRFLRSKKIQVQDDSLVTSRTLRSKKSNVQGPIHSTDTKVTIEDTENKHCGTKQDTNQHEVKTGKEEGIAILHQNKKRRKEFDNHDASIKQSSPPLKLRVTTNTVNMNKVLANHVDKENYYLEEENFNQKEEKPALEGINKSKSIPIEEGTKDKPKLTPGSQKEQSSIVMKPGSKRIDLIALALKNIQKRKHQRLNKNLEAAYTTRLMDCKLGEYPKSIQNNKNDTIYITRRSKRIELRKQNKYKGKERVTNKEKQKINFNNNDVVKSLKEYVKCAEGVDFHLSRENIGKIISKDKMSQEHYETSEVGRRIGKRKLSNKICREDEHDEVSKKSKKSFSREHNLIKTLSSSSRKHEDQNVFNKALPSPDNSLRKTRAGRTLVKHGNTWKDMKASHSLRKQVLLSEASKKKHFYLGKLIMENPEVYRTKGNIQQELVKYGTRSRIQGLSNINESEQAYFYLGKMGGLIKSNLGTYWTKDNRDGTRKSTRLSLSANKNNMGCENSKKTTLVSSKSKGATKKVISKNVRKNHSKVVSSRNLTLVKHGERHNIKVSPNISKEILSDKGKNANLDTRKLKVATKTVISKHVKKKRSKAEVKHKTRESIEVSPNVSKKGLSDQKKKTNSNSSKSKVAVSKVIPKHVVTKHSKVVPSSSQTVVKHKTKGSIIISPNVSKKTLNDKMKKTNLDSCKPKVSVKKVMTKHVRRDDTKVGPNRDKVLAKRGTKNSMEALVNVSKADLLSNESKQDAFYSALARLVTENLGTYWTKDNRDQKLIKYGTRKSMRSLDSIKNKICGNNKTTSFVSSIPNKVSIKKVVSKHVRKNNSTIVSNRHKTLVKHGEQKNIKVSVNNSKEELLSGETSFDSNKSNAAIKAIPPTHVLKDPTKAAANSDMSLVKCRTRGDVKGLLNISKGNSLSDEKKKTKGVLLRNFRRSHMKVIPKRSKWLNVSYERLRAFVYLSTLGMSAFKP